jgi:membrane associated rhomboid family serine protease
MPFMHIHAIDPAFAPPVRARANLRIAAILSLCFVALTWLVQVSNALLDLGPGDLGIRPRVADGLLGILFAPLMHGGFDHLIANSAPLFVLGTAMLYLYPRASLRVLPAIYVGPGVAVWLFARDAVHLGASGLVYGLWSYILASGLIRRDRRAIGAALLVCFMYGAMVWGVLPLEQGVSWETHLAAAVIGLVLAPLTRRQDVAPRRVYSWEQESAELEQQREHEHADHHEHDGDLDGSAEQQADPRGDADLPRANRVAARDELTEGGTGERHEHETP